MKRVLGGWSTKIHVLRSSSMLKSARGIADKALVFFVVNAAIPPLLLFMLSKAQGELVYSLLWPLIAYFVACLFSIALLQVGRSALAEYSLDSAQRLFLLSGVLGLFTGLIIGGLLTLRARSAILKAVEVERVKKPRRGEAP